MDTNKVAAELVSIAKDLMAAWPSKVEEGGLRGAMGLKKDESLEEQTSPSAVIKFFKSADEKGRGMVMFAVNSNKDVDFWKKVADGIKEKSAGVKKAYPKATLDSLQVKVAHQQGKKLAQPLISQAIKKAFDYETDKRLNPNQDSIMDAMLHAILDEASSVITKRKRQI